MKLTQIVSKLSIAIAIATCFVGCSDDDEPIVAPNGTVKTADVMLSRATDYGNDWIYFSLEQGKEVQVNEAEHNTALTWDLAFNRYNVRTNSGLTAGGQGGAYDFGKVEFDAVTSVPADAVFAVDTTWEITESVASMPPTYMLSTANPLLSVVYKSAGMPPQYLSDEHIYIVKTATGKYAKVLFIGYYSDDVPPKAGVLSFKYSLQTDGSNGFIVD
jgi:hypothetical protein